MVKNNTILNVDLFLHKMVYPGDILYQKQMRIYSAVVKGWTKAGR